MSFYDTLRHLADSHFLVGMFLVFLVLCAWPFRPGSKTSNRAAATSIFQDNDDGE